MLSGAMCLSSSPVLEFQSSFLLMLLGQVLESLPSMWETSAQLMPSAWPNPGCSQHLGSELLFLFLPIKNNLKKIKEKAFLRNIRLSCVFDKYLYFKRKLLI